MSLEHSPAREARPKGDRRSQAAPFDFQDRWLSRRDAAKYLGLTEQTLAHDAVHRRLGVPFAKFGHLARYRLSSLVRWAEERERARVEGAA